MSCFDCWRARRSRTIAALALTALAGAASAAPGLDPRAGLVLDVGAASQALEPGGRDQGLRLGGVEFSVESPLGPWLEGRLAAAAHSHERKIERHLEEAWIGSTALPAGLQARAGRFMSQLGYLNEQHPHADDFLNRPLLYRAFLGRHYFDTGARLNWTAPTELYWRVGLEAFTGKPLSTEATRRPVPGVWTLSSKLGGDLNREHSWQAGVSYLRNRRAAFPQPEALDAGHGDGAWLAGRHLWVLDGVWKWAPGGNNRAQQLRLSAEYAQLTGLGEGAAQPGRSRSAYVAAVYRLGESWEVGARSDWLNGRPVHDEQTLTARRREHSVMLAWKPSHQQTLRVQYSRQTAAPGLDRSGRSFYVQYVHSFGAHGAHSF